VAARRQLHGVLPIAFGVNLEFVSREITVGAPATQWWIHLSTAIVFGLGFSNCPHSDRHAGGTDGDREHAGVAAALDRKVASDAAGSCGARLIDWGA
jgi:hypothetical protein